MDDVLGEVPVAEDVVAALLQRAGGKGRALRMAEACEAADWEAAALPALPAEQLAALAGEALVWADRTLGAAAAPEPEPALV
jgi:EAL and modified HD-GYP domain-containing signal transduction protein